MPSMKFTDASVRNLKPPPKPKQVSYFDTMERGLALELLVSYGGTNTIRFLLPSHVPNSRRSP